MNLGLKDSVQRIINNYRANCETKQAALSAVYDPFKEPSFAGRFSDSGIKEYIKEKVESINAEWKNADIAFNAEMKTAIARAESSIMSALKTNEPDKPADYAVRIGNARAFLKDMIYYIEIPESGFNDALAAEIDRNMYMTLKDFINDYDTMSLFNMMVERKFPIMKANSETCFPRTFGKMNEINDYETALNDLNGLSENIFLRTRMNGNEALRYHNMIFFLPIDPYSETAAEGNIIDIAGHLDEKAENINAEGIA